MKDYLIEKKKTLIKILTGVNVFFVFVLFWNFFLNIWFDFDIKSVQILNSWISLMIKFMFLILVIKIFYDVIIIDKEKKTWKNSLMISFFLLLITFMLFSSLFIL